MTYSRIILAHLLRKPSFAKWFRSIQGNYWNQKHGACRLYAVYPKEARCDRIQFIPEFLRQGRVLYDSLHPLRIIVGISDGGEETEHAGAFSRISRRRERRRHIFRSFLRTLMNRKRSNCLQIHIRLCVPQDTKLLNANFSNISNRIVSAVAESNHIGKDFTANQIIVRKPAAAEEDEFIGSNLWAAIGSQDF